MTTVLFALAFIDELASGVPSVAAPAIQTAFSLSHTTTAVVLFVVPGLVALVVEPIVFLLADRHPRAIFIRAGVAGMAASALLAAVAPNAIVLAIAVALSWISIGASTSLAQATLVDQHPEQRGRTLARWTMLANAGDLGGPILLAAIAGLGMGWRSGFLILGIALSLWTVLTWRARLPAGVGAGDDEDEAPAAPRRGLLATLRDALRDRVLVAWLFGVALCDLLDEILVVFATLHVRDVLGGGPFWQSAVVASCVGGSALGLVVLDRLLAKRAETTLLVAAAAGTAVALVAWVAAPTLLASAILMAPVGAFAAPLYPLAAAQAYARRPAESGAVLAAGNLFVPMGLMLPWLIGLVADRAGTTVALLVLLAQPLGLVALVALDRQRSGVRST